MVATESPSEEKGNSAGYTSQWLVNSIGTQAMVPGDATAFERTRAAIRPT